MADSTTTTATTSTTTSTTMTGNSHKNNYVLCPAWTYDYRIEPQQHGGLGLVANRAMAKGENVFSESLEFCFSDVQDGDALLFVNNYAGVDDDNDHGDDDDDSDDEKKTDEANSANAFRDTASIKGGQEEEKKKSALPLCFPIDRKVLLETHGVPMLVSSSSSSSSSTNNNHNSSSNKDNELKERWHLESPGMLMNHACNPTVAPDSFDWLNGVGIATRDMAKGEPLTCDYAAFDYDEDGLTFTCSCGADQCRGKNIGFEALAVEDQERMLAGATSDVVRARHQHAIGLGPPVSRMEQPPLPRPAPATTVAAAAAAEVVPRLVVPGPSCGLDETADICIRPCAPTTKDDTVTLGLFALKDVKAGRLVYYYWSQPWPTFPTNNSSNLIDMVWSLDLDPESDAPEGTVVRLDPRLCASQDSAAASAGSQTGGGASNYHFTGYDLLTHHSCDPNVAYRYSEEEEEQNWRGAYACRDIQKGDQILVDFNCCQWDRTTKDDEADVTENCQCGAANCRKTVQGFCRLAPEAQDELYAMNRQRLPATTASKRGTALSPYIRRQLEKYN